jgi:hypothetical protein
MFALLISMCIISSAWASTADGNRNLTTDEGLRAFVQKNDTVMSRVFDVCRDVSITRSKQRGLNIFRLKATCTIKANPEGDLDCPEYRIDASGTIDNAIQATVRSLTMSLGCTA